MLQLYLALHYYGNLYMHICNRLEGIGTHRGIAKFTSLQRTPLQLYTIYNFNFNYNFAKKG